MLTALFFIWFMLQEHCSGMNLTYYVDEEQGPGFYLGNIAADSHLLDTVPTEERSLVRFIVLTQRLDPNPLLFRVSKKTGKLYTAQTLDAESLCSFNTECFRTLKVAVQQADVFKRILKIKVIIKDINDHEPTFPEQEINIQFSEADSPGMKIMIPNSIDNDVDYMNSHVTYQLKSNPVDPFSLSELKSIDGISDLSIVLEDRLDHEVKGFYDVQVIAKDGGSPPKESVLKVHISVKDVNDNPPVFAQNIYNVSIKSEHSKFTPVVGLSAKDADGEKNAQISYHLSPRTSIQARNHFKLNEVTGEIFLQKSFEPGQKPIYKLFVQATDNGTPALSAIATVLINVLNQQNTAPRIDISFVSEFFRNTASIFEDLSVDSFFAYVMVTDNDIGQNGDVRCTLKHKKFQLQSIGLKEYKVTVKEELDRESEDHFDVTIECRDNAIPPLLTEKKFGIQLLDVNDVPPVLTKDTFTFWIYENLEPRFPVGNINATDPDLDYNGMLTYSLESNNKEMFLPFVISPEGFISTVMSLDHEFQDIYHFHVIVKDNGIPSLSSTSNVIVKIRDENDNAPYFTFPSVNPFTLKIHYYHSKNITLLKAFDIDSRENAFLKFEIHSGNEQQLFAISPYTGMLSFTREVTQLDAGTHLLEVIVKDSGLPMRSSTTKITLKLTVSNRTSEFRNKVLTQTEEKLHINVLISILVVSVLLSIPMTASVSFCIMRLKERRDALHRNKMNSPYKCPTDEHEHNMCSSHETTYWSGVPTTLANDHNVMMNTLLTQSNRSLYLLEDSKKKGKDTDSVDIYQEIDEKMEEKQFMSLDCPSQNTDGSIEEVSDLYSSQYYKLHSPPANHLPGTLKRGGKPQVFPNPRSTSTVSRSLYKLNIGHIPDCSQWPSLSDVTEDNDSVNPKNRLTNPQSGNRNKPPPLPRKLPPIPSAAPSYNS